MEYTAGAELKNACLKQLLFFVALFFVSLSVATNFPATQKSTELVRNTDNEKEKEQNPIALLVSEERESEKDYNTYLDGSMDSALALYRNPQTRSAVALFYSGITGSSAISEAILSEANRNDISPSLAFAIAYMESRYKRKARNVNTDMSVDRGLFQLNSKSFPNLSDEEYFNAEINARHALSHFAWCLDASARNERIALCIYNAGEYRVKKGETPNMTLRYAEKVLSYKKSLDKRLEKEVGDDFFMKNSGQLAFVKLP